MFILGFIVGGYGGDLYGQTTPLPDPGARAMELAWMHPLSSPAEVEVNRHLEVGFKADMEHRRKIDNYLDERSVPDVLNPFDPKDLDIQFIFTRVDSDSGEELEIYRRFGFWYREYLRDMGAEDPNAWTHRELQTPFSFRGRFTPQTPGDYTVKAIVIEQQRDTIYTPTTFFKVKQGYGKGYVGIGKNNRFLVRDGSSFFPIGQNLPTPTCRPSVDSTCAKIDCAEREAWCMGKILGPAAYTVYEKELELLASSGGNYFRFVVAPWAQEIEFEKLNNYDNRMHSAWEIDRVLEKTESLGLLMHFNLQFHFPLEDPSVYGMWHWDFGDFHCYRHDDAYCYARDLELASPIDFIRSNAALNHYKNRLRYYIARYGHSTSIAVFELYNEVNNIGSGYSYTADCKRVDAPKYKPYHDDPGVAEAIGNWQKELARYVKVELNHTEHLLAVNYTGTPAFSLGDDSFYSPHVDLATYNHYNLSIDKYYKAAGTLENFRSRTPNRKLSDGNPPDVKKPLFYSEVGPGPEDVALCDNDIRWVMEFWMSAFTGLAGTGLNWSNQSNPELWQNFGRLAKLIEPYDFDRDRFAPYRAENSNGTFDLLALRSTRGLRSAIGILHNRTRNFYSNSTDEGSVCRDPNWLIAGFVPQRLQNASEITYSQRERVSRLENMGSLQRYTIEFFDALTGDLLDRRSARSGLSGGLDIVHPPLRAEGSPFIVFRAWRINDDRQSE